MSEISIEKDPPLARATHCTPGYALGVTLLALAALGALAIGVGNLYYADYLPAFFKFSLLWTGIFLGAGSVLSCVVLYLGGRALLLPPSAPGSNGDTVQISQENEKRLRTPVNENGNSVYSSDISNSSNSSNSSDISNSSNSSDSSDSSIEEGNGDEEKSIEEGSRKGRGSKEVDFTVSSPPDFLYVMRLLKNYDPTLLEKYTPSGRHCLSHFLKTLADLHLHEATKKRLRDLKRIQKACEAGDYQRVYQFYRSWWVGGNPTPFCFFFRESVEEPSCYTLITLPSGAKTLNLIQAKEFFEAMQAWCRHGQQLPEKSQQLFFESQKAGVFSRLFHEAIRSDTKEEFALSKKIYKISLFSQLLAEYHNWQEDPDFVRWVRGSLLHLHHGMIWELDADHPLYSAWEEAKQQLEDVEGLLLKYERPLLSSEAPNSFTPCSLWLDELPPYPGMPVLEPANQPTQQSVEENREELTLSQLPPVSTTLSPEYTRKQIENNIERWYETLFSLYKGGKPYELIESYAIDLLLTLPTQLTEDYFLKFSPKTISRLGHIGLLAINMHLASGRFLLHPSRHLAFLKLLNLCLARYNKKNNVLCTLDVSVWQKTLLLDPYCDMAGFGAEILQVIESIKKQGHRDPEIPSSNHKPLTIESFGADNEVTSLFTLMTVCSAPEDWVHLVGREKESLPVYVERVRQAIVGYMEPALNNKELFYIKYNLVWKSEPGYPNSPTHGHGEWLYKQYVGDHPRGRKPGQTLRFKYTTPYRWSGLQDCIRDPLYPSYYVWGGPRQARVRLQITEATIANYAMGHMSPDGYRAQDVPVLEFPKRDRLKSYYGRFGLKITPRMLADEEVMIPQLEEMPLDPPLTKEQLQDLRKLPTSRENRAFQTLHTFRRHVTLLREYDYQKVFRNFIFTGDLLWRELSINQLMARKTLELFDELFEQANKLQDRKIWLFLYQVHSDLIRFLTPTHPLVKERIEFQENLEEQLLQWIEKAELEANPTLQPLRAEMHLMLLYGVETTPLSEEKELKYGRSLMRALSLIDELTLTDPLIGQWLTHIKYRLATRLIARIEKRQDFSFLNELFLYLLPDGRKAEWKRVASGVYETVTLQLDLNVCQLILNNRLNGLLPLSLRRDPQLHLLFGKEVLEKAHTLTRCQTAYGTAWYLELSAKARRYHLYINEADSRFPLIFRQREKSAEEDPEVWDYLLRNLNTEGWLPADLVQGFVWDTGNNTISIENATGAVLYEAVFNEDQLTDLWRYQKGEWVDVVTVDDPMLGRLDHLEHFVATRQKEGGNKQIQVAYLRGALEYRWNPDQQLWESLTHLNYFLSNESPAEWLGGQRTPNPDAPLYRESFFISSFDHYHFLKKSTGEAKLIVPYLQFDRQAGYTRISNQEEIKYARQLIPLVESNSVWQRQQLATFDLTIQGLPTSKRPCDCLYLAYVLFVQGKYAEALVYLQRSQATWTVIDSETEPLRQKLIDWILAWYDDTPEALVFKIRALLGEHRLYENSSPDQEKLLQIDSRLLPSLMELAHRYYRLKEQGKVESSLIEITQEEKEALSDLAPRAYEFVETDLEVHFCSDESLAQCKDDKLQPQQRLLWSINTRITRLKAQLKDLPPQQKEISIEEMVAVEEIKDPVALLDLAPWMIKDEHLSEETQKTHEKTHLLVEELKQVFENDAPTFADVLGVEIIRSIQEFQTTVTEEPDFKENCDYEGLINALKDKWQLAIGREQEQREKIRKCFKLPALDPKKQIEQQLKEQNLLIAERFEEALYCFGLDDYAPLESRGVLQDAVTAEILHAAILEYEIARTERQLFERKIESVNKMLEDPKDLVLRAECLAILQTWRRYDPKKHPYAPLILLLEDQLKITAQGRQITYIKDYLRNPDSFLPRVMAGGKTIFLRNLISMIERRKGFYPGVITYDPLKKMHHAEYQSVNQGAFGCEVLPQFFQRNSPHDLVALRLMLLAHLRGYLGNGLIDLTPQAILSLNNTLREFIHQLRDNSQDERKERAPQINALQELMELRSLYVFIFGDEILKIYDPFHYYNYSQTLIALEKEHYQPMLWVLRILMEAQEGTPLFQFGQCISQNRLPTLATSEFDGYLQALAGGVYEAMNLSFAEEHKQKMIDYLTEVHQQDPVKQSEIVAFYNDIILKHSKPEEVQQLQLLHSFIGVLFRGLKGKMVGCDFGIAGDGITVKPYAYSGVCQETSQRSFVLATVLETCVTYFFAGVTAKGAEQYVRAYEEFAMKQLENYESLEETPVAIEFRNKMGISLSQIQPEDYKKIADKLREKANSLEEFLTLILFAPFKYSPQKFQGNPHQIPQLVKSSAGASGTSEGAEILPAEMKRPEELVHEFGAMGSVIWAILKSSKDEDFFAVSPSDPNFAQEIGSRLSPGDVFVDNVPFFPGEKHIIDRIRPYLPEEPKGGFRSLNDEGAIIISTQDGEQRGDDQVDVSQIISVIDQKGRQGTNWRFAIGTKGIVESGVDSNFEMMVQSYLRLRLLGKGQRVLTAFDKELEKKWEACEKLKGKTIFTKLIWSWVQNEATTLKRYHFSAGKQKITAVRASVIDRLNREIKDVEALFKLQNLKGYDVLSTNCLNVEQCGEPIVLVDSYDELVALIEKEKKVLESLQKQIEQGDFTSQVKEICQKVIQESLGRLDANRLLVKRDRIQEKTARHLQAVDETEDMQVEQQVVGEDEEQGGAGVNEVEIALQQDLLLEQRHSEMQSLEKNSWGHPLYVDQKGEQVTNGLPQNWWKKLKDPSSSKENRNYSLHGEGFSHLHISYHGLGVYREDLDPITDESVKNQRLWIAGGEKAPVIAPTALLVETPDGELHCQLGSIKDMDFASYHPMHGQYLADLWQGSATSKLASPYNNLCREERIDAATGDEEHRKTESKIFQTKGYRFYKIDLTNITAPPDEQLSRQIYPLWSKQIAQAKFLYMSRRFSDEELIALKKWLATQDKARLQIWLKNLESYLTDDPLKEEHICLISLRQALSS